MPARRSTTCDARAPLELPEPAPDPGAPVGLPPNPNVGDHKLILSKDAQLTNLVKTLFTVTSTELDRTRQPCDESQAWLGVPLDRRSPVSTADFCLPPQARRGGPSTSSSRPLTVLKTPATPGATGPERRHLHLGRLPRQHVGRRRRRGSGHGHAPGTRRAPTPRGRVLPPSRPRPTRTSRAASRPRASTRRTFTSWADTYPEGTTWWRVQAVDGVGQLSSAWSTPRSFVKASPTPALSLPSPGPVRARRLPPCRGSRCTSRAAYVVEVYKNNDMVPGDGQPRRQRHHQPGRARAGLFLDPGAGPYTWRVRRNDAEGRDGAWSALQSFTVAAPAPSLLRAPFVSELQWGGAVRSGCSPGPPWSRGRRQVQVRANAEKGRHHLGRRARSTRPAPRRRADRRDRWRQLGVAGHRIRHGRSSWPGGLQPGRIRSQLWTRRSRPPGRSASAGPAAVAEGTLTLNPPNWGAHVYEGPGHHDLPVVPGQPPRDQPARLGNDVRGTVSADVGKALTVRATAVRPGYKTGTSTSNAITGAQAGAPLASTPVVMNGTGLYDSPLRLHPAHLGRRWCHHHLPVVPRHVGDRRCDGHVVHGRHR